MVLQGDGVKEDIVDVRIGGSQERLAASGTLGKVKPNTGSLLKFSAARATIGRNIGGSIMTPVINDVHLTNSLRETPRALRTSCKTFPRFGQCLFNLIQMDLAVLHEFPVLLFYRPAVTGTVCAAHNASFQILSML